MTTPPRLCANCRTARVAWSVPRVDCCYACLPGGPFVPPPCWRCNSTTYFSQGLCDICHPGSPKHPGSCRDCLAWGVLREHNWRCWTCRGWRSRHPVGACPYCGQERPLGADGACRLCWKNAEHARAIGEPIDLAAANQHGQQLFLANLHYQPRGRGVSASQGAARPSARANQRPPNAVSSGIYQLALFPTPRPTLRSTTVLPNPADPALAAHCDRVLREHAAQHGWTKRLTNVVAASLRAVLAWQDTPGGPIKTSEARRLLHQPNRTTVESTLEVLAVAGLLDDDRAEAARTAFLARIAGLPATMTAQVETWYTIMAEGSKQPPRRRPRHPRTIDVHVNALRPILRAWADHGHQSLAEITRTHITASLPTDPVARPLAGTGLDSSWG